MSNIFDLSQKVAVVTGASSGLGAQMAKALAERGAQVALLARRTEKLQQVKQEIEANNQTQALAVTCDVTQPDQIKAAVQKTLDEFGQIDILVNNAGVAVVDTADKMDLEDWQKEINVNLTGVFLCSQYFGRVMIEQKYGKIINITSIFGKIGNTQFPALAYHATKGGVTNLTRGLAAEWAEHNITVNAIGPGFFMSEMTEDIKKDQEADQFIKSGTPMNRWGREGELNGALLLLASDASSYITGQVIYVDGGWTAI